MSAHKFRLILTEPAQFDFRGIANYTLETWGERQAIIYRNKIQKALDSIKGNPDRGKKTNSGRYTFIAEKHKIFYRIENKTIIILRILHQRMDEGQHLQ